jgi:hypothetical protein
METKKMSLATLKGKLSRAEMKNIMAGSSSNCGEYLQACSKSKPCCENRNLNCSHDVLEHCNYN